ncbi:hypothetical protein B0A49_07571 [Cryomyces minteri]|uniref:Letm1 RBD domain-containing protein n=1 Tax=Cryomyces minteri TaxID=331657 RepID=A0A4U0WL98_9PEZI|nr:hypothetical protein B0A49_07571 [Cryomyces minteri]
MTLRAPGSCLAVSKNLNAHFFPTSPSSILLSLRVAQHRDHPITHSYGPCVLLGRYASTASSAPDVPTRPHPKNTLVNPPITTLPAPLFVPARKPDQGLFSYLLATGKSYLTFYKTGIKNIYANYKAARALNERLRNTQSIATRDPLRAPEAVSTGRRKGFIEDAVANKRLTRGEFQLLARNRHDMKRVPVFALMFAVFGEWLPLVVPFVPNLVPLPCRLPTQSLTETEKREKRRSQSFRELVMEPPRPEAGAEELKDEQVKHISASLGLHGRWWETVRLPPPVGLLKRRVGGRAEFLAMDDTLMRKDGGVGDLDGEELRLACEERGIDVLGKSQAELRRTLKLWMEGSRGGKGIVRLLLTRPSVWDSPVTKEKRIAL